MPKKARHLKRKNERDTQQASEEARLESEDEEARLLTDDALNAGLEEMRLKFQLAKDGLKEAEQQEELIRKMLGDARKAPREGGESVLREYIRVAQLSPVFKVFLGELADELSAAGL